ncbi:unnamed protein product [Sphacelaria rigidula]
MRGTTTSDERRAGYIENAQLVATAHELRRSLDPPHQSLFRVVCILLYEDVSGKMRRITGTNCEPSTIGGSICAERAAMCKLREVTDCKLVTKVVVVTDSPRPLPPGVLCREFLSAHLPPCTPVIMAGSGDDTLLSDAGGFEYDKHDSQSPSVVNTDLDAKYHARTSEAEVAQSTCNCAKEERSDEGAGQPRGTVPPRGGSGCIDMTTVGQLYPWRNLYGLTPRGDQLRLGFVRQQASQNLSKAGVAESLGLDNATVDAYDKTQKATEDDNQDGVHPIRYAAAAVFPDGQLEITHQVKALEYGATLDPVTLLAPVLMRRAKGGIRPSCVLLVDQFGNLHAPFAQARTFLCEQGFGNTRVVVHGADGRLVVLKAQDLVPRVTTGGGSLC